ncbi:MAG: homoserine kinase [Acidimicrobiia bacterium]
MRASAPASSANLGPGFDCLALALDLQCTVEVSPATDWNVGPVDPGGFVESAARRLSESPLTVEVTSDIPVGRGLGSSAAVLAALTLAIWRHQGKPDDQESLFRSVAGAEGHPDNAAAAVYGGLVYSDSRATRRLEFHKSWRPVVAVPDVALSTPEARAALPASLPIEVAVRTAARLVRLVEGLRTGDTDLLRSIDADELHEPHRIALRPVIGKLLDAVRAAGAPFAAISGSGPSVIALTTGGEFEEVAAALRSIESVEVVAPSVSTLGAS